MNKDEQKKITAKLDKFDEWYKKERGIISKMRDKYQKEYVQVKAIALSELKIEFIDKQDEYAMATTGMKKYQFELERVAKDVEYNERLKLRKDGNTLDECKYKSWIHASPYHMLALRAEICHDKARDLKNMVRDYKDEIIQRISIVKGEEFNARQPH